MTQSSKTKPFKPTTRRPGVWPIYRLPGRLTVHHAHPLSYEPGALCDALIQAAEMRKRGAAGAGAQRAKNGKAFGTRNGTIEGLSAKSVRRRVAP